MITDGSENDMGMVAGVFGTGTSHLLRSNRNIPQFLSGENSFNWINQKRYTFFGLNTPAFQNWRKQTCKREKYFVAWDKDSIKEKFKTKKQTEYHYGWVETQEIPWEVWPWKKKKTKWTPWTSNFSRWGYIILEIESTLESLCIWRSRDLDKISELSYQWPNLYVRKDEQLQYLPTKSRPTRAGAVVELGYEH